MRSFRDFSDALVPNWLGDFVFEGFGIARHIEPPFISLLKTWSIRAKLESEKAGYAEFIPGLR